MRGCDRDRGYPHHEEHNQRTVTRPLTIISFKFCHIRSIGTNRICRTWLDHTLKNLRILSHTRLDKYLWYCLFL